MNKTPIFRAAAFMMLMVLLTACGGDSPAAVQMTQPTYAPPQGVPIAQYRLGSGDELRITIFGEENMDNTYKVDGAGMISLPLIGNVRAGNLTVPELQAQIAHQLSQGFLVNPRVSVQVMNYRPFFILGEVNRPNQYPYVEGMKVINAVAMAGGYTYRANESRMSIVRANDAARARQPADPNSFVMPGDTIEIQERLF